MSRIGIFGGTFDPPHKGHIAIAEEAMKQLSLDTIYFVPAYLPPHKLQHYSMTAKHRLTMVKLAIDGHKDFKVSMVELQRRGISYTVDTLKAFRSRFPNAALILVIGADNLEQFQSWKSPKAILQLASLAVYKRRGFNRSLKNQNIAFQLIKGQLLQVSSTEIRKRLVKGLTVSKLLSRPIERYIKRHSLYLRSYPIIRKRKINEINRTH
ncbi:MAG: nicotinate (nicotinamide) nucleotide adenylyltransferase [Bacteroidota bacterium]|jgi:nicotinate-nucleotide adenylyltransferase